jgi:hypothetical protein
MVAAYSPDTDVYVVCPHTRVKTRVTMGWDTDGDPVVAGCARFWGGLDCDASCWTDAVVEFDILEIMQEPRFAPIRISDRPDRAVPAQAVELIGIRGSRSG